MDNAVNFSMDFFWEFNMEKNNQKAKKKIFYHEYDGK